MVIWLFAGGGESEREGLTKFLKKHVPYPHRVDRKLPIRQKPGPRPDRQRTYSDGATGAHFTRLVRQRLCETLAHEHADNALVLIIDDLDCHEPETKSHSLREAIRNGIAEAGDQATRNDLDTLLDNTIIGFAAPEIESWIVADWEATIGHHPSFRAKSRAIQFELRKRGVDFNDPESFSELDPDRSTCKQKLSVTICDAVTQAGCSVRYQKGRHTPELLLCVDPPKVSQRCLPMFKMWWEALFDALRE